MTALSLRLPLARRSPIHIPRRDLVVGAADSLALAITIVASDTPDAAAVNLVGLGPQLRLSIWQATGTWFGGYGMPDGRQTLAALLATATPGVDGTATLSLGRGVLSGRGLRLGYTIELDLVDDVSTLCWGALHVQPGTKLAAQGDIDILEGTYLPITDDADQDVEA